MIQFRDGETIYKEVNRPAMIIDKVAGIRLKYGELQDLEKVLQDMRQKYNDANIEENAEILKQVQEIIGNIQLPSIEEIKDMGNDLILVELHANQNLVNACLGSNMYLMKFLKDNKFIS